MCYSAQVRADYRHHRAARIVISICVAALLSAARLAVADSLVLDFAASILTIKGSDLLVVNHGVSIRVDAYDIEERDMIKRSGFDATYWSWQLFLEGGALAEGDGYCLMESDVPDVRLKCDGR